MQVREDKYKNIFQIMLEADMKFQALKKNVIALVGKTKAGKSTCSNWICARPMIGFGQIQARCDYKNMVQDASSIGNKNRASETLIPNILSIDADKSLIDMAGYGDSRNYIGVLGVSHMLKSVFQKAQNIKFIIVVNESDLIANQGQTNCEPFFNFIDMFNFSGISQQSKTKILSSTSLVVSIANIPLDQMISLIKGILNSIRTPNFNFEKKEQIIQLLEHLINNNKIQIFPRAKNGVPSPECTLLKDLEQTNNWNYFSFGQLKKIEKKEVVKLPFAKLYGRLEQEQRAQFKREIQQRTQFYNKCQSLFLQMFKTPQIETQEKGEDQRKQNWYRKKINYDISRKYIETQILDNSTMNCYKGCNYEITESYKQTYTGLKFEQKNQPPTGIQLIKLLEEIWHETVKLQGKRPEEDYPDFLTRLQNHMKMTFKKIKKIYCANKADEEKFNHFTFIFLRGFQQFRMLCQIERQIIAAAPQQISNTINAYFEKDINEIKAEFMLNLKTDYLKSQQVTKNMLEILKDEIENIFQGKLPRNINIQDLKLKQIIIYQCFANIFFKEQNFKKAIITFLNLDKKIQQLSDLIESKDDDDDDDDPVNKSKTTQTAKKDLPIFKIKNYGNIAQCLYKLNQVRAAFPIFKAINYIPSAIKCSKADIKMHSGSYKFQLILNFVEYLIGIGRINQSYEYLQQAYQLCQTSGQLQLVKVWLKKLEDTPQIQMIKKFRTTIDPGSIKLATQMKQVRDIAEEQEWC